ncbi:MAG: DUF4358 domain-containing protein [Clostridia bacterium]|nr:DUF4358 domain-containing protein [Clostridia bacterium]
MSHTPHSVRFLCLFAGLLLCLRFVGCAPEGGITAHALILAATDAEGALPAGDIYLLPSSASLRALDSVDTLEQTVRISDISLLCDAFGSGDHAGLPAAFEGAIDDGAMRFSSAASPCELIVFHCVSRANTQAVAELLHERLDILRRQYQGSDDEALLARAEIVVMGKYVFLLVCNDPEAVVSAMRRKIF